jgi:hypothetical protein
VALDDPAIERRQAVSAAKHADGLIEKLSGIRWNRRGERRKKQKDRDQHRWQT